MTQVEFDELWRDLLRGEYKDGGYENLRQVIGYVTGLSEHKRQVFLNELVSVGLNKKYGWSIALGVLESEATPEQIQRLCQNVRSIRAEPETESNLVYVLRVLAKDPRGDCLAPVEDYLLNGPFRIYWSSVPWSLWPHHPDLFVRAWERYFTKRPSNEWRDTVVPQAFLSRTEALSALKSRLQATSSGAWRELRSALNKHREAPWLNDEQRSALSELLA